VSGALSAFTVVSSPAPGEMTVGVPASTGVEISTAIDGQILVTPAPGFLGTATIGYVVAGTTGPVAAATITVTGNQPPVAEPDTITAAQGVDTVIDPAVLLANDHDPDPNAALRVVSVSGTDNGTAWLDVDGLVHVLPANAGTAVFTYVIADDGGALSLARVTATVAASEQPTTSTSTSTTSTSTSTTSATVVPETTSTSTTSTSVAPDPSTSTTPSTIRRLGSTTTSTVASSSTVVTTPTSLDPGDGSGPLPFTGGESRAMVMFALSCLFAGAFLARRRKRAR
jgi:hypothetical protein